MNRGGQDMTSQRPGGLSVIEQLAAYVATEAFDKLPDAAVAAARRAILDTLGVTLAGAVEPTAARVRAPPGGAAARLRRGARHCVRGRRRDRGEARAGAEPRPLRDRLARDGRP